MRKGAQTRQEIIRKAAPIFNQRGYDGRSVNLIWPLSIVSFGPTPSGYISLTRSEAKPCDARRAARLGRSERRLTQTQEKSTGS